MNSRTLYVVALGLLLSPTLGNKVNKEVGNDFVCEITTGNCDCGKAKTCQCKITTGNCNANEVTDEVTAAVQTGNVFARIAKKVTCATTSGNCYSEKATEFTCGTTSGNCGAGAKNSGGTVTCAIQGAGNCFCGNADVCKGAITSGSLSCESANECDCSGVTTGQCCTKSGTTTKAGTSTSTSSAGNCVGKQPYAWSSSGGSGGSGGSDSDDTKSEGTCSCSCQSTTGTGTQFANNDWKTSEANCNPDGCTEKWGEEKCPSTNSQRSANFQKSSSTTAKSEASVVKVGVVGAAVASVITLVNF